MIGSEGADNCHKFVDILGLRTIFPLFMKTPKKMKKTGTSEKEHEGQYQRRHFQGDGGKLLDVFGSGLSGFAVTCFLQVDIIVCCCQFTPSIQLSLIFPSALLNLTCLFGKSWGRLRQEPKIACAVLCSLLHYQLNTLNVEPLPLSLSILIKLVSSAAAFKPCGEEQIACLCVLTQLGNRWINLWHHQAEGEECAR